MTYRAVTYRAVTYRAVTYRAVTYRAVTYRAVTYRAVTYRAVRFRTLRTWVVGVALVWGLTSGLSRGAHAASWDPGAQDYAGHQGLTLYVSKLGDNSDGLSWGTAFTTIQAALGRVPDAQGGHRVIVRPDTYMEANLYVPSPGAPGSYNLLIGDTDGRHGSGTQGRVVIDSGDAAKGFKSYDWWSTIRATAQGWSPEHKAPTFSSILWDRWIVRNLYATGADAGLFWDCTNRVEPFTIVVEDCVSIGRAFGGGVASCLSRYDEPIAFRRCKLWSLDEWGDTAGLYIRVENPAMPERPDVVVEDCTLISPQCAMKGGNYGFHTYMRIQANRCRFITLNFSQPAGTPTDGVVQSVQNGKYLHVDFQDCTLMGYKIFGVKVDKSSAQDIGFTAKGAVNAYVQWTQDVPQGMHRLVSWPVEVFDQISMPAVADPRPPRREETPILRDACEVSPLVWKDRLCLLVCHRPASGGTPADYYLTISDVETGEELARFGNGYSLASAVVLGGKLCVSASRFEENNWNDVTVFTSTDLRTWTQQVAITQEPTEHLFNSSLCQGPDGYVLAYESNDPAYPAFTIKFAQSTDLETWTKLPDATFGTDRYTACPTIRYANGFYYVFYLEQRTPRWFFETYVTRSADLKQWYRSPLNPVLSPQQIDDAINASDPDLVEFQGKTYLYYAVGNQLTWMNIKRATFPVPLADFLNAWYPSEGIRDAGDVAGYQARAEAEAKAKRQEWFRNAKFGMFVHWGPFAVHSSDPNAKFDYFDIKANPALNVEFEAYARQFQGKSFDAAKWMETAQAAGAKYVVLTAKHHDGYALFDSQVSQFDSVDMAPQKDFARAFADAARAAGLKVGFYYSMLDWHEPMYRTNLPKFVDEFMFPQVRELCTQYGPLDCVWFDGEWDHPAAAWKAPELVRMIRELQPAALVNDRLGLGERGVTRLCDFYTREQPSEINVAMGFERDKPYPWEACMTIGEYWQYSIKDTQFKSTAELIRMLVDVVSRGGNLLLNVGPNADGEIPLPLVERMQGIGTWLTTNGEGIYDTSGSPFKTLPAGKCTTKGNRLYIHLDKRPDGPVQLPGLQNTIQRAWFLNGGAELTFDTKTKTIVLPETLPDDAVTTVVVELDAPPVVQ
ncbi:MAG: alpha-L-fucosidase [Pirellulaceae bacterium]